MKSLYTKPRLVSKIRRTHTSAYTSNWAVISESIMKRDGYKCRQCGAPRHQVRLEVHHIIPVSRGGKTVSFNLKTLCVHCHSKQPFHSHLR